MEHIMGIDELEAFVLDFLAYRRERRKQPPQYLPPTPKLLEHKAPAQPQPTPVSSAIGRGWPYYKDMAKNYQPASHGTDEWTGNAQVSHHEPSPTAHPTPSNFPKKRQGPAPAQHDTPQSDIIPTLAPIVTDAISRYGSPTSPKSLEHLVHQVIASAMTLPPVSESISTAELAPWGRVSLLQAVVELLILLHLQ